MSVSASNKNQIVRYVDTDRNRTCCGTFIDPRDTFNLQDQILARRVQWFTLKQSDRLTDAELLEHRDRSFEMLAQLVRRPDVASLHIGLLAARIDALDAAIAERAWETISRPVEELKARLVIEVG